MDQRLRRLERDWCASKSPELIQPLVAARFRVLEEDIISSEVIYRVVEDLIIPRLVDAIEEAAGRFLPSRVPFVMGEDPSPTWDEILPTWCVFYLKEMDWTLNLISKIEQDFSPGNDEIPVRHSMMLGPYSQQRKKVDGDWPGDHLSAIFCDSASQLDPDCFGLSKMILRYSGGPNSEIWTTFTPSTFLWTQLLSWELGC